MLKVLAIVIGIAAGLGGLSLALFAELLMHVFVGDTSQEQGRLLLTAVFWLPPALMLIGALVTIRWRVAGGILMLAGALGWGWAGPNIYTAASIVGAALAGILALVSARSKKAASPVT